MMARKAFSRVGVALCALGLCLGESGCEPDLSGIASEDEGGRERHDWIVISDVSGRWGNSTKTYYNTYVVIGHEYALHQHGTTVTGTFVERYESGPAFQSDASGEYDHTTGVLTLHYGERDRDTTDTTPFREEAVTKTFKFTSKTEMHWTFGDRDVETYVKK